MPSDQLSTVTRHRDLTRLRRERQQTAAVDVGLGGRDPNARPIPGRRESGRQLGTLETGGGEVLPVGQTVTVTAGSVDDAEVEWTGLQNPPVQGGFVGLTLPTVGIACPVTGYYDANLRLTPTNGPVVAEVRVDGTPVDSVTLSGPSPVHLPCGVVRRSQDLTVHVDGEASGLRLTWQLVDVPQFIIDEDDEPVLFDELLLSVNQVGSLSTSVTGHTWNEFDDLRLSGTEGSPVALPVGVPRYAWFVTHRNSGIADQPDPDALIFSGIPSGVEHWRQEDILWSGYNPESDEVQVIRGNLLRWRELSGSHVVEAAYADNSPPGNYINGDWEGLWGAAVVREDSVDLGLGDAEDYTLLDVPTIFTTPNTDGDLLHSLVLPDRPGYVWLCHWHLHRLVGSNSAVRGRVVSPDGPTPVRRGSSGSQWGDLGNPDFRRGRVVTPAQGQTIEWRATGFTPTADYNFVLFGWHALHRVLPAFS